MLTLRDFNYLPELTELLPEVLRSGRGLIVVAGWGGLNRSHAAGSDRVLPSGRAAFHGILLNEFLQANPEGRVVQVTRDASEPKRPKTRFGQVVTSRVYKTRPYSVLLPAAASARPDLIVLDELTPENLRSALEAADNVPVLTQLETVLHGAEVRWLLEAYAGQPPVGEGLAWVISVERLRGLCASCAVPDPQAVERLERLLDRPQEKSLLRLAAELEGAAFACAHGCGQCQSTGRAGEVAVFDVLQIENTPVGKPREVRRLSREAYMLRLAARGMLSLEDIQTLDAAHMRQLQSMLAEQEAQVEETQRTLQRRLVELEAANLVLQHRTEQLISLENISQMLIGLDDAHELSKQVCRRLETLFAADYAVMYALVGQPEARPRQLEILAVHGWSSQVIGRQFPWHPRPDSEIQLRLSPYQGLPPGLSPLDVQQARLSLPEDLKAGLLIPLVAQEGLVGIMVVQSSRKQAFTPGDQALLRTFANQTALALQRTRLLAARIEKEKLERELELARRLQQSLLPSRFPEIPGLQITAANRAARWVGGDFYDLFQIDPSHLGLVIGDASDKGIPAALYMALTRSLILAEAHREASTELVLRSVNQHLLGMGELRGFITVFFGVLDLDSRELAYTRAGHDRPVLIRGGRLHPLEGGGMLLGMFPETELELEEKRLQLQPGDQLVLYTDGVMDVVGSTGALLPRAQLDELLLRYMPLPDGCQQLLAHLQKQQGGGEQFDDMTMMCLTLGE